MAHDPLILCELFMFQTDLLTCCLESLGLHWEWLNPSSCRRYFKPHLGDTILRYRNSWDEQFRNRIRRFKTAELLNADAIEVYVEEYARDCFQNQPLRKLPEQFFLYSAFLVDLVIFCCRYNRPELIDKIIFCIAPAFDDYLMHVQNHVFWYEFLRAVKRQNAFAGRVHEKR